MKAQICPNCSAADWKEVDGYRVCTYCGTKIPIPKEEQAVTNSLVGKWVSNEIGQKDTLIIEDDLTGVMISEFPPKTTTVKELGYDDCGLHGYMHIAKMNMKLTKRRVSYLIEGNKVYVESYANESHESSESDTYVNLGVLVPLSDTQLLTITEGDETIFEKVE